MGSINLKHTGSGSAIALSSDGTSLLLNGTAIGGGGGASELTFLQKAANYTITNGDLGKFIQNTSLSTITFDLPAVANISTGWYVYIQARSGECIIDSNISFGINFSTTFTLEKGGTAKVVFNGTSFYLFQEPSNFNLGGIALGDNAFASQNADATAIGKSASATGSSAVALGSFAVSSGSGSVALRNSYASGADSFAAAIANNTSSYGATSVGGIAMGELTKSTGANSIAIGKSNIASGQYGVSLGLSNTVSGQYSIAIGYNSTANHTMSASIGANVNSTDSYQVNIGGSIQEVRISEAYTLPSDDGTASGQVLTTDGSGTVSWAAAGGGGADLYSANESSPTAQPSATGTNAIAIGDSALAVGTNSFSGPKSYSSGYSSFAVAINNNSTTYGAKDSQAIAMGYRSIASGVHSVSIGRDGNASGAYGISLGLSSHATGGMALSIGHNNDVTHYQSAALGKSITSTADYQVNIGGSTQDVRISEVYTLPKVDGSANEVLTTDGSGAVSWAAAGGGGALELISTNTFTSSASSLEFTNISGYTHYRVVFALNTSGAGVLYIRVGINGTYDTGSNYNLSGSSQDKVQMFGGFAGKAYCGETHITHLNQALSTKIYSSGIMESNDATSTNNYETGGGHRTTTAQNSIQIFGSSGNIPSGIISLYGVKV